MTDRLTIRRPDDWHVHLRDGAMLRAVAPYTARQFARAIIMPNLSPPVTSIAAAEAYRARIMGALTDSTDFTPLMTCYLTDDADAAEIARGHAAGVFTACKLYPANATTNSAHGVTDIGKLAPVFEAMQRIGMPLLIHGEVTDRDVDIFDREAVFIDRVLDPAGRAISPGSRSCSSISRPRRRRISFRGSDADGRRDDHAAASPHQPQRDLRRWYPAACLLPAGREARAASRRDPRGGGVGVGEVFSGHR